MTELSKRFEQIIRSTQKRLYEQGALMPVKIENGILVGDVKITSQGSFKDIWLKDRLLYESIALNDSAIKIANIVACNKSIKIADKIYEFDKQYSKHFNDYSFYLDKYHKAIEQKDEFKSDLYWIRCQEAKYNSDQCKNSITRISTF